MDFEDSTFELLEVGDHIEEVARLRIALRAEHAHEALGRLGEGAVESVEVIRMQERLKTLQEVEALSEQERVEYWASRTPNERHAAAWEMTKEHYRKLGLWHEGMKMDKTITRRIVGRDAWRAAEESDIG